MKTTYLAIIVAFLLAMVFPCHAGEAKLFEKFRRENQAAGEKVKQKTIRNLEMVESMRSTAPDEAARILRTNLHELEDDIGLSAAERNSLLTTLTSRLREFERLAAEKRQEEKRRAEDELADAARRLQVAQAAAGAAFQVTPVVSPDRRFVRVGVNGIFTTMTPGPPFAGPGFSTMGLNTTASVPVGGAITVGGFTTSASARYESGVPVLGHIPYVGRLFNNVGYGSASNTMQVQIRAAPIYFLP